MGKPKYRKNKLNKDRLKELLEYNPKTSVFKWLKSKGSMKAGSVAGTLHHGYIQIKLDKGEFEVSGNKAKATWNLKLREWLWYSEFEDNKITFLAARDSTKTRFQWGQMKKRITNNEFISTEQ